MTIKGSFPSLVGAVVLIQLACVHAVQPHAFSSILASCPALPPHTATHINDLRPNDVKVIMAVGDSITAGFGIRGLSGDLNEYRGQSWSIGGDAGAVTLPNFFRQFTPNIQYPSAGSHFVELCYGILCPPFQYHESVDRLNSAQSGAMVLDLPDHEMDYLIDQLKRNKNIDMKNDWKVMTLFIGANDLCASCAFIEKDFLDPEEFGYNLLQTIERARRDIPRLFINLGEMFNLSQVYDLSLKKKACATIHRDLFIECDCIFAPEAAGDRIKVDNYVQAYNAQMRKIAAKYAAMNLTDFAVVIQPFGRDTMIKNFDVSFLSDLDCFHPSLAAHEVMATALWNAMLTPAAKKKTVLNITDVPICPTASTLLYVN